MRPASRRARAPRLTLEELVDQAGVGADLIKDLEDWQLVQPGKVDGTKVYDDTDREVVKACAELARFVGGRNLKVLRTAADREAVLLEAVVGPGTALLEPQPPAGGDREFGEPGRGVQQPHPHAAGPRPAEADRRGITPSARGTRRAQAPHRRARRRALAVIADPYRPRWWPNTQRVENVSEGDPAGRSWTQVLGTRGGRGVRADFRCIDASDGQRYVFEQTVEGTPFERFVRIARTEIELDALNGETEVTIALERRLRGLSRLTHDAEGDPAHAERRAPRTGDGGDRDGGLAP